MAREQNYIILSEDTALIKQCHDCRLCGKLILPKETKVVSTCMNKHNICIPCARKVGDLGERATEALEQDTEGWTYSDLIR